MIDFNTHPDQYKHWKLSFDGPIARLDLDVQQDHPFAPGYELKLNSYDLGVDIELADAVQRIRFEHPQTRVVIVSSANDRVFCAGANIPMLASSPHPFKVNFCKYTNETRCSIEDASQHSGIRWIAALNGITAGGGYELALACDEIYLIDDGNSVVSLPEVPLLGVLPGTGGLTRLVDKRKVRRDLADRFATMAEGVKGKRAKLWHLIDDHFPKSQFEEKVLERAQALASELPEKSGPGIRLNPVEPTPHEKGFAYRFVNVEVDAERRVATLTMHGPEGPPPKDSAGYVAAGDDVWALRAFRELNDALLRLRFEHLEVGLVLLETTGDIDLVLEAERSLKEHRDHWLVNEILQFMARTCSRFELTARSFYALVKEQSAFAGPLYELAMACDRIYMLDDPDRPCEIAVGCLSDGSLPMANGLSRIENRFLRDPEHARKLSKEQPRVGPEDADRLGLVTVVADEIDWDEEIRVALEERACLSPDALTGMEASLRFGGAETCDSKIYGRLSAWQNWIFTRPNATGETGALVRYGHPMPASFDWRRT